MGCMLFKKTTTYNAHLRVYIIVLHDTQLVMRNDEMYETCDIHKLLFFIQIVTWYSSPPPPPGLVVDQHTLLWEEVRWGGTTAVGVDSQGPGLGT